MKTKTVFKLLEEINGGYYSWSPPVGCSQQYFVSILNKPKIRGSGMFVFDTLAAATEFDKFSLQRRVIFECKATGVRKRKIRMGISSNLPEVKRFWKNWRTAYSFQKTEVKKYVSICKTLRLVKRVV